ncbi:organomercurial lyase [Methylobacterium durans]|uniref:Uncharacterized protein n=1 Tax=Methylobacterium durans TaxID=2202825 RepID=A0A2U8W8Z7_9HYPH|nr:hypothetical protein DK389_21490 [Methylobacterium durans]
MSPCDGSWSGLPLLPPAGAARGAGQPRRPEAARCGTRPRTKPSSGTTSLTRGAAGSCCRTTTFFCSHEHRRRWLTGRSERRDGAALALDEALEVGRAIFGSIFSESVRPEISWV